MLLSDTLRNNHSKEKIHTEFLCAEGLSDYIVLDIETTGFSPSQHKIIEIAMIKFVDGEYSSCYESFLNPCCHIPPRITELTGICDADVIEAPPLRNLIHEIDSFIGDHVIIGHNVTFDLSFLQYSYQSILGSKKQFQYIDTLSLARVAFPAFPKHSLDFLKSQLRIEAGRAHRAMSDVICTNQLIHSCLSCISIPMHHMLKTFYYRAEMNPKKYENVTPTMMKPNCTSFDCNHALFGKTIVFTGTFLNSKDCLMQNALDVGATVKTSVSSKTHCLIVGKQDIAVVGEDGMSSKQEKAIALNESGRVAINIIDEAEFLKLVKDGAKPDVFDDVSELIVK